MPSRCGKHPRAGQSVRGIDMTSICRSHPVEYHAWQEMKRRCYNPRHRNFDRYGGRGIAVCDEWMNDSAQFLADMGPKPGPKYSLDRIDVDGPYCPSNCRWATSEEQSRNRSDTHHLTFRGETMCLVDWARRVGMSPNTIRYRLDRGWTTEQALTVVPEKGRPEDIANHALTADDVRTIRARYTPRCPVNGRQALAREYGVSVDTIASVVHRRKYLWVD